MRAPIRTERLILEWTERPGTIAFCGFRPLSDAEEIELVFGLAPGIAG